jgi:hypothetical protein
MTFEPGELLDDAVRAAGADDLGATWVPEGLEVLCAAIRDEARLNPLGEMAVRANIVGNLATRLRVVAWQNQHAAELATEVIESPIVVIGHFRAGTTYLSGLLDQDPANRALLRWEAHDPVPPPAPGEHRSGPRVDAVRATAAGMDAINPRFKSIHHEEADGPTECIAVMSQAFMSLLWESVANVPSYSEWLFGVDQRPAYAYHRDVLRTLQSGGVRGRWTLKSPHHAIALEALTSELPGSTLVMLHRDPLAVSASVCSLITTLSGTFTDADHAAYIAHHWTGVLEACIERSDAFRAAHPEVPILDLQYADLIRDPVGTMAQIAEAAGGELGDDARRNLQRYVAANPKGRFGAHRYDLASFGLVAGELEERFASYIERYGVEREAAGS